MTSIVLIRPGLTEYDQQERIQGDLEVPLNTEGVREAREMAHQLRRLGISVIYAGEDEPAVETGQILGDQLHAKVVYLPRFRNLHMGLWQGMLMDDVKEKQPKVYRKWQDKPDTVCPPQGENPWSARQRIREALAKILRRHKEGTVGIVVREPLASFVRQELTHGELGDLWKASRCNATWEILEVGSPAMA